MGEPGAASESFRAEILPQLNLHKQKSGCSDGKIWKCLEKSLSFMNECLHLHITENSNSSHLSETEVDFFSYKINLRLGGSGMA